MTDLRKAALACLALGLLFSGAAVGQAQGDFGDELYVTEVLLDVLVTDDDGNVILGLGPEDFAVQEDGAPVDLQSVTFYSNRAILETPAELAAKGLVVDRAPQARYFVLFFQEQQRVNPDVPGLLQRQLQAARESRRWVERELLLDDYVAVVSYDAKLEVHQDFTRDKSLVLNAIDSAVTGQDPGANWPSRIPAETASLRARLPQGKELRRATRNVYDALQVLADATGSFVGRKNLILFSTGFGQLNSFGQYKPDVRYFQPTLEKLNTNNVAIYSVDLWPSDGSFHALGGGLNQIADETGGRYYSVFNNFDAPLGKIAAENSGYYLLSYRSRHPAGSSGYQKVSVALKSPDLKVRAREGYLYGSK